MPGELERDAEQRQLAENIRNNPSVDEIYRSLVQEANRLGLGNDGGSSYASQGGSKYLSVGKKIGKVGDSDLWNDDLKIRVANHGSRTAVGPPGTVLTTTQSPQELRANIQAAKRRMAEIARGR